MKEFSDFVNIQEFKQSLEEVFLLKKDILTDEQADLIATAISSFDFHDDDDFDALNNLNAQIIRIIKNSGINDDDFEESRLIYSAEGYNTSKTNLLLMKAREIAKKQREQDKNKKGA